MPDTQPSETPALYMDDLEVGQIFVSGTQLVDNSRMLAFAAEFDPQPFHLTGESPAFGGLIASGWLTAALTHSLLLKGGFPIVGGMIGLSVDITWPKPTRAGDILRVSTEVIEIKPSRSNPGRGIVSICSRTFNHTNDVVQIQRAKVVMCRRDGHSS